MYTLLTATIYSHVLFHYNTLTTYYSQDQLQRKMKMWEYSGRQRTYEEMVKCLIGGSKKYGPLRPNQARQTKGKKKKKWRRKKPKDPDPTKRLTLAFGDASVSTSLRGTLTIIQIQVLILNRNFTIFC